NCNQQVPVRFKVNFCFCLPKACNSQLLSDAEDDDEVDRTTKNWFLNAKRS
ncbi:unnamed protein product, partial [Trichobilharzia szidati]